MRRSSVAELFAAAEWLQGTQVAGDFKGRIPGDEMVGANE